MVDGDSNRHKTMTDTLAGVSVIDPGGVLLQVFFCT
jgi:hypothetical protein